LLTQDVAILKTVKAKDARLMGLDIGDRTVGVSLSDTTWQISTPLKTIERRGTLKEVEVIRQLINEHTVVGVVAGYPLNMNGSEGPQAQKVRTFAQALAQALELPVVLWDERWSTLAASRTLLEADLSRKKQRRVIDQVAAVYILQGVLDALNRGK